MKLIRLNQGPIAGITVLFVCQSFVPVARAFISNDYKSDDEESYLPPVLRSMTNSTITNYNECSTECAFDEGVVGCLGFSGEDCSFPFVICPDSVTQCFGPLATCVDQSETPNARDYNCDCQAQSIEENPISASMQESRLQDCRDQITEVCEKDKTVSVYAFCTNGGKCVDQIQEGEAHPGCYCPGRFVGRHCEKRRGTGTDYRFEYPQRDFGEEKDRIPKQNEKQGIIENRGRSTSMGAVVAILVSFLSGFLVYAGVLYKRFLATRNANPAEDSKAETSIPPGGNDNVSALEVN